VDFAVPHLVRCRPCLDRAAGAVAELKRAGRLAQPEDARGAVLALLDAEEGDARSRLLARAAWAELKSLCPEEQVERIQAEPALQTLEMFEVVVEEAASLAPHDPFLGEETALVAHALAGCLPQGRFSQAFRNDRLSEAMEVVANCRRLAADWRGCAAALGAARKHHDQGTGKPAREARLLSVQASLATDTGHLEQAQTLLARAADLHRKAGDRSALASITVQEASTLLAASRYEEAAARAEEAMRLLTPRETLLEMLARNMITECLVFLGRPASALKNYLATRPLREQHRQRRTELQSEYLEALLLESFGHAREAEKAFRSNVASRMEAEHYKDAFLTLLTRFELLFRRDDMDRAAQVCEEALATIRQAGVACHAQMEEFWRRLLAMVHTRQLTEIHLLAARHYLLRHWNAPAPHPPLEQVGSSSQAAAVPPAQRSTVRILIPDAADTSFEVDDYATALERHDRSLIAVALAQCRGNVSETARLLGIARATLRARIIR
jgi:tetratricopeptide (TPR) repeat protein